MKNVALIAAATLTLAAPAFAQSQLERSLGVPAGVYSQAELALLQAKSSEDGNDARVYFSRDNVATRNAAKADNFDRLALSLGVTPGSLTPNQLIALKSFQEEDGNQSSVYTGASRSNVTSPALAGSLGVNPIEYSLADLALLKNAEDNDGNF